MEAMSELLRTAACWPDWVVLGGPLKAGPDSPSAVPKLLSSLLHPACTNMLAKAHVIGQTRAVRQLCAQTLATEGNTKT